MSVAGFIVLAVMISAYVLTDGYDLGVATVAPFVSKSDAQRSAAMHAIGPFLSGNEVWLIAAGGALFALFPQAYASAFSGFYLPFIIVLWLLMFRGIAMELRNHFPSSLWHDFWDFAFSLSSALLILLLGIALGNLLRGVPLDAHGFFEGTFGFLLNPYAIGVGVLGVAALAQHGATFLMFRIDGPPAERSRHAVARLWPAVLVLYVLVTVSTLRVRPAAIEHSPLVAVLPVIALAALIALRAAVARGRAVLAFQTSCVFIASLLVAAAATLYPYLLPAYPASAGGLSIFAASPSSIALATALSFTIFGVIVVAIYSLAIARRMREKVVVE